MKEYLKIIIIIVIMTGVLAGCSGNAESAVLNTTIDEFEVTVTDINARLAALEAQVSQYEPDSSEDISNLKSSVKALEFIVGNQDTEGQIKETIDQMIANNELAGPEIMKQVFETIGTLTEANIATANDIIKIGEGYNTLRDIIISLTDIINGHQEIFESLVGISASSSTYSTTVNTSTATTTLPSDEIN